MYEISSQFNFENLNLVWLNKFTEDRLQQNLNNLFLQQRKGEGSIPSLGRCRVGVMVALKMINNGLVIIFVDKLLSLPVSMRPQRVNG